MVSPATPTPSTGGKTEAAVKVFGSDPWMRFDLWSNRAWEAAQAAVEVSREIGSPIGSEDHLDPRIITSFHAASVAKDFADMVNPVDAMCSDGGPEMFGTGSDATIILDMIAGTAED